MCANAGLPPHPSLSAIVPHYFQLRDIYARQLKSGILFFKCAVKMHFSKPDSICYLANVDSNLNQRTRVVTKQPVLSRDSLEFIY